MLRSVEYTTRATVNLKAIKAFIAQENPSAALRVVEYITDSADRLIDHPLMGKPWTKAGTRKLVLSTFPYSIIYKLTPAKVIVLAVAHQSRKNKQIRFSRKP
jgi:addiction module RelE/StbE family toxin